MRQLASLSLRSNGPFLRRSGQCFEPCCLRELASKVFETDDATLDSRGDRLGPILRAEFGEDALKMVFDGGSGHVEGKADFLVAEPLQEAI